MATKSKSKPKPKTSKPLSTAAVVDALRQAIFRGELVPGQRLVEAELCESLGTTRGSVRASFAELDHEGLVERSPNKGARVRVVQLEEALQIAEVRMVLETLCVGRAARRITDGDVARFREIAKQMKHRAEHGDVAGFAELTHRAFEMYVRIADQPVAEEILVKLRARNTRHRFRLTYRAGRPRVALPYWLDLISAICNRDPDEAQEALKRHHENVQEAMKALAQETSGISPTTWMQPAE